MAARTLVGMGLAHAIAMHEPSVTLIELQRLHTRCLAVRHSLTADQVDLSDLERIHQNLREDSFAVLAALAQGADDLRGLQELAASVDLLGPGTEYRAGLEPGSSAVLTRLCTGHPRLVRTAVDLLAAVTDLGRLVRALRLVDSVIERRGADGVRQLVDRVGKNVLQLDSGQAAGGPADDRTIQLGSKLALERIASSPVCPDELRGRVSALLLCIGLNLARIGPSPRARLTALWQSLPRDGSGAVTAPIDERREPSRRIDTPVQGST